MKKILKIILVTVASLLLLAGVAPWLFKGRIAEETRRLLAEYIDAEVAVDRLGVSLFRHFPDASVSLHQVSVVGHAPFEGDTLVAFRTLQVVVDLKSLLHPDRMTVKRVLLAEPVVMLHADDAGRCNWDIFNFPAGEDEEPSPQEEPSGFHVGLNIDRLEISDARLSYADDSSRMQVALSPLQFSLAGRLSEDSTLLALHTDLGEVSFWYEDDCLLNRVHASWDAAVAANLADMCFALQENTLKINDLSLYLTGRAGLQDDALTVDMAFGAPEAQLKSLLSLVPAVYMQDYQSLQTTGFLEVAGTVQGVCDSVRMPDVTLRLGVKDGTVRYESLPEQIERINVSLEAAYHGTDMDQSWATLHQAAFAVAGNTFSLSGTLQTPESDPQIQAAAKGVIDFRSLGHCLPMLPETLQGVLRMDASAGLKMSDLEAEAYERMEVAGDLSLQNFSVEMDSLPALAVRQADLGFSPRQVTLETSGIRAGRSRIDKVSGSLTQFLPWMLSDGVLQGTLDLKASCVDLNEWMTSDMPVDTAAVSDTVALEAPVIPDNLNLLLTVDVDTLLYDNLLLEQAGGSVAVRDSRVLLQPLRTRLLGGRFDLNGSYTADSTQPPSFQLDVNVASVEASSLIRAFETIKRFVPQADIFNGRLSAALTLSSQLNNDLTPMMPSLRASGSLLTEQVSLTRSPVMSAVTSLLGNQVKDQSISLKDTRISFTESDGVVALSPFSLNLGSGISMQLGGNIGLDRTVDYQIKLQLPASLAAGLTGNSVQALSRLNGGNVTVAGSVTGSLTQPKVKLDLAGMLKDNLTQNLTSAVTGIVTGTPVGLSEEEAQKIRNEANKAADKLRSEAEQAAVKLEEAAGANALKKAAARVAADKLRKEADQAARKLLDEAERRIAAPDSLSAR